MSTQDELSPLLDTTLTLVGRIHSIPRSQACLYQFYLDPTRLLDRLECPRSLVSEGHPVPLYQNTGEVGLPDPPPV